MGGRSLNVACGAIGDYLYETGIFKQQKQALENACF